MSVAQATRRNQYNAGYVFHVVLSINGNRPGGNVDRTNVSR